MDGGVKPIAEAVSLIKVLACCSVKGATSAMRKGISSSPALPSGRLSGLPSE